jgi:hypothetical protein
MLSNNKSSALLACGLLLVLIGSAPLNGYIGVLLWPSEFHHDAFLGSIAHLLLGAIPWLTGTMLIALGSNKASHVLAIAAISLGLGCFMALPSFIQATDYWGAVGWLGIVTVGVILAALTRGAVNRHKKLRAASILCR